jgi:CRP-like cAMP-binding protein
MSARLFELLSSIIPISDKLKSRLNEILILDSFPRKHLLLKKGQVCNNIYFIEKGFVRSYRVKQNREITSWFMKENDVIISVSSFFKREPSLEYLQVLEDSMLCSIHYDQLQSLYREFPEFNIAGRILVERYYVLSEERASSL